MENKTIEYILTRPIKVGKDGDFIEGEIIKITEPIYRDIHKANILQQQFLIATQKARNFSNEKDKKVATEEIELKGLDYFNILMLGDANIELCINTLKELLKNSGFINDNIKITDNILTQISIKDFNNILGEYLKSFLLADLMS